MRRTTISLIAVVAVATMFTAGSALAKKPAPTPPPPDPEGPAFDRPAAAAALGSISLLPCKQSRGPSGDGHVLVTFAPTGEAVEVKVDRAPYKDTAVGRCIAMQYKRAQVPKFAGPPVTVGKTFHLD